MYIITFPSTYQALNFEKKYKETGLKFTLRPVPREISSSCGIAAQLTTDEISIKNLWAECRKYKIETDGLFFLEKQGGKAVVSTILIGQE
ncbi:MAG: DUF3343 domain-containing protein [Bacillota bacterium]